uniref:RNA-directed DNA polymerase (Reverse transcriptase) n=1 Tax=Medicago truncatula TaxID=3880 RepID=A2Q338_MEDTR|nr:RNA-directed DNA polymerase (Reverse transcriptase) [Medicago truncatula]
MIQTIPGPDGLNSAFYHRFWKELGGEIFFVASSWLTSGSFPPELNATHIVLAPKGDNPEYMKDLRPISLCNVLYKIISKVLANRLRPLIDKWISTEQAAFVPSRSIMDNAITAFEVLHCMKCKRKGKTGDIALKLDISKAFDSVSWSYLQAILCKLGFSPQWISWMMMCISTVEYHVIFNGDRIGPIIPGRGLRQGCPLSPYLYIICAEGLSAIIKNHEFRGKIHGVRICRTTPSISHLLFADDNFLFCKATESEAQYVKDIISSITASLGVHNNIGSGKYLGLPSMVGRNKNAIFSYLKDRIWKKCQSWSVRSLSRADKEVLIKSVAQAIPSYCMGAFLIPASLCEELERMMNSFYWGSKKNGRRGINWMRWDFLTLHKSLGGLGFRNLEAFNLSMLGKQGWKLLSDSSSLFTRILKAKYFPRRDFLDATLGHNPSYTWRSLWSTQSLLTLGHRWKIGDGSKINVWSMPWIRNLLSLKPSTSPPLHQHDLTVNSLLSADFNSWDTTLVQSLFNDAEAAAILSTPLFARSGSDVRIWKATVDGTYTVKSAYRICSDLLLAATLIRNNLSWNTI